MGESDKERSEQLIEQMTQQIDRWGLALPAALFLHIARPLSFLGSQGLLLCQPMLGFFYDASRITDYADLLADKANIDRLIARLEESDQLGGNEEKEGD